MSLVIPLLLLILAIPLVLALVRANELFCLRWNGERLRIVRGRLPKALLDDIDDILRRGTVAPVTLRGVSEDRIVRAYADGALSDAQRQQLRNVLAQWPVAKLRAALPPKR